MNPLQLDFTGKSAVVTGGSNGIGLAIARALASGGAAVSIFDLASENPDETARTLGGRGFAVDVTDQASIDAAFTAAGDPDIVAVNAGIGATASFCETSSELWNRTIAVNLAGAFHTMQGAAKCMKRRGGGAIVVVASTNSFDGEANLAAYNASKAGLLGLIHTAANELGTFGIRVNGVCPGLIRTRLTASHFADPAVLSAYFRHIPLGRGGEPEEVARTVAFLASGLASYITGATLFVDGGQMASKFGVWTEEDATFDGQRWVRKPQPER